MGGLKMPFYHQVIEGFLSKAFDYEKNDRFKNTPKMKLDNSPIQTNNQGLDFIITKDGNFFKHNGVVQNEFCVTPDHNRKRVLSPNGKLLYHKHTFFEFIYVYQGSCQCFLDGIEHIFHQNQVCIMNTNTLHTMHVHPHSYILNVLISTRLFDEIFIQLMSGNDSFLSFFLDSIYNRKNKSKFYIFDLLPNSDCEFFLQKLISECIKNPHRKQQEKKSIFICLLYALSEQYQDSLEKPSSKSALNFATLIEYISDNYNTVTLENIADHFHYTANSMSRYIKKQTGRTFSDILRSIRLKNSYYLLSYTNLSIEEIADKLGYHERSYFEKIFKQYCGITPAEYRKKHTTLEKI